MPIDDRHGSAEDRIPQDLKETLSNKKQIVPIDTKLVEEPEMILTKEHEEWTTCKRVVNHKTKQVETRIQRQIILEDGRVVADSGPQVTTKTTEDVRVEETENTERKMTGDSPSRPGYSIIPGSVTVICEKKQSNQVIKESKEEKRQLHDEHFRELSGEELHHKMLILPNNPTISNTEDPSSEYPGTLTHFSSHSQKVIDKEEVKEVTELKNGEQSTETVRTHHHEEAYDDEVPEGEADCEDIPEKSSETSRIIQYYTDPKEFDALSEQLQRESLQNRGRLQSASKDSVGNLQWHGSCVGSERDVTQTRTSSGGNKIIIEMSGNKSSHSDLSCSNDSVPNEESFMHNRFIDTNSKQMKWIRVSNGASSPSPYETISKSIDKKHPKTFVKAFYLGENNNHSRQNQKYSSSPDDGTKYRSCAGISASNRNRNNTHNCALSTKRAEVNNFATRDGFPHSKSFGSQKYINKSDKEIQVSMSDDNSSDEEINSCKREQHSTLLYNAPERQNYTAPSRKANFIPSYIEHSTSKEYDPRHLQEYDYCGSTYSSAHNSSPSALLFSAQEGDLQRSSMPMSWNLRRNISSTQKRANSSYSKRSGERLRKDCYNHPCFVKTEGEINNYGKTSGDSYRKKNSKGKAKTSNIFPQKEIFGRRNMPTSVFPSNTPVYRLTKDKSFDICDSSSSLSSHEYPSRSNERVIHSRQKPLSSLKSSKSSSDLQSPKLFSSFIPLNTSSDIYTMNSKRDRQKYYRKKSGSHTKVQVYDWK